MSRAGLLAAAVLLAAAATVLGSDLSRHARFAGLYGGADTFESAGTRSLRGGLQITGERIQLENGNFTATVAQVAHPYFVMTGMGARGRMPLDAAFFADAITAAVNNVLEGSTVTMATFKNAREEDLAGITREEDLAGITLKEIHLVHTRKALSGSLKALIAHPEFRGRSSYDKATRKLTVTVESVKLAGIGVPLGVAFFTMGQFMKYPFVTLSNPNVIIDLKPFLPPPSF